MTTPYGQIDPEDMPSKKILRMWEREARNKYTAKMDISYERFEMDYVWQKISRWQREKLVRDIAGRVC